jgi:hypothetical protein
MRHVGIFVIAALLATSTLFVGCKKDEKSTPKPVINLKELGYFNHETGILESKIAYAGKDLHVESEILAEGKIDKIIIQIHPEEQHGKKNFYSVSANEQWELDTTFTEFTGLKNVDFHKHIDVPVNTPTGHYHFHLIVNDMEGQQTTVEEEIEIKK